MSLDTVLSIGHTLRASSSSLDYFAYVAKCPTEKDGTYPLCISIPVTKEFEIKWNDMSIVPENKRTSLYYLKYKTTDRDNQVKYIFGDIYYEVVPKINKSGKYEKTEEGGYYRVLTDKTSFARGKENASAIENTDLKKFRNSFESGEKYITRILKYICVVKDFIEKKHNIYQDSSLVEILSNEQSLIQNAKALIQEKYGEKIKKTGLKDNALLKLASGKIFIHFEFPNHSSWYNQGEIWASVSGNILEEYVQKQNNKYVLNKSLYKALSAGQEDCQMPSFSIENRYKTHEFSKDEILDLFYGVNMCGKILGTILKNTNIKLIVLPKGDNLKAEDYLLFKEKQNEANILIANSSDEDLFNISTDITVFDLIFCRTGGSSPDFDVIEISNIERSNLKATKSRISRIARTVYREMQNELNTSRDLLPISIGSCLNKIFGQPKEANGKILFVSNKKYDQHILNILPLMYENHFYDDPWLMSSFINNVEYTIRADNEQFIFLKFSFKFLIDIQNNKTSRYMEIINSPSYLVGQKLGQLAKPLGRKINSFQKSYVGMLTRRASTKSDAIVLANDIIEKLVMHDCSYQTSLCGNVCANIASLTGYDKEQFAFGFFEGYFKYVTNDSSDKFVEKVENLISDFSNNGDLTETLGNIKNIIEEFKNK